MKGKYCPSLLSKPYLPPVASVFLTYKTQRLLLATENVEKPVTDGLEGAFPKR